MISVNYQPSAKQKLWQNACRFVGCPLTGSKQVQVHHLEGASFKIDKVHVGQWLTMAIHWEMHDPNVDHEFHIAKRKKAFEAEFGSYYQMLEKQRKMVAAEYPNADFLIPLEVMELAKDHYALHEDTADSWLKVLGG